MNLSPEWILILRQHGFDALHWSTFGRSAAPDSELMQWARENNAVVFTHDLDFGMLLAHTRAGSPSVRQVRTQDVTPDHLAAIVISVLSDHREALETGALVTVDQNKGEGPDPPHPQALKRRSRGSTATSGLYGQI